MIPLRVLALVLLFWPLGLAGCAPSARHAEENIAAAKADEPVQEEAKQPEIDWASATNCRSKLSLLQQGLTTGQIEALEKTPFVLISDQPLAGWRGAGQPSLALSEGLSRTAGSGDRTKQCVLRLGKVREHKAEHRQIGRERVRSSYQSGSRSEKNPAYEAAQVRLRQAERANKPGKSSIITVGDPLIDLIGLVLGGAISGITHWSEGDPVEEAIENLMATPRSIEKPVYRSYQFDRTRFRASREAIMPVIMTDRHLQKSWRVSLKRREVRELAVLDGLDRQDRDYAEHRDGGMTAQEFRQWQTEPPELPLEDMVASLLEGGSAATSIDRIASLDQGRYEQAAFDESDIPDAAVLPAKEGEMSLHEFQGTEAAGLSPGAAMASQSSIIEVFGEEGRGLGVYVAPDFVLAGSDVVGRQGLVDVDDGSGGRVLGLVAAADRSRGLALVQVPRSGMPAMLGGGRLRRFEGRSPDDPRRNRNSVSGPILDGQYLLGFKNERGPDISIQEIRAFLDEQQSFLITQR